MKKEIKGTIQKIIRGDNNKERKDILLQMAIQQGYVSKECKLNGELVMCLINSGENPCNGCNFFQCPNKKE